MNDRAYDDWRRARASAPVPQGFEDRVMESVELERTRSRPLAHLGAAALALLAFSALLFRIGSTLTVILST